MAHTFNPCTWELEAENLCEFKATLAYIVPSQSELHQETLCQKIKLKKSTVTFYFVCVGGWMGRQVGGWMGRQVDRQVDGWVSRWLDGKMVDGQIDMCSWLDMHLDG